MQAVGQFVGLDADEGRLRLVHCPVELFLRHVAQLLGEELLKLGKNSLNKGPGATDNILIEPGLAFMDSH